MLEINQAIPSAHAGDLMNYNTIFRTEMSLRRMLFTYFPPDGRLHLCGQLLHFNAERLITSVPSESEVVRQVWKELRIFARRSVVDYLTQARVDEIHDTKRTRSLSLRRGCAPLLHSHHLHRLVSSLFRIPDINPIIDTQFTPSQMHHQVPTFCRGKL